MDTRNESHGGLNAAVAAVIKAERVMAGLTQAELGELSGLGKQQVMRRETGKSRSKINVDEVAALAAVFRLTPAEMIAKAEDWQRRNPDDATIAYNDAYDSNHVGDPPPGKKQNQSA